MSEGRPRSAGTEQHSRSSGFPRHHTPVGMVHWEALLLARHGPEHPRGAQTLPPRQASGGHISLLARDFLISDHAAMFFENLFYPHL